MFPPELPARIQSYLCADYRRLPFEVVTSPPFIALLTLPENRFGESFAVLEQPISGEIQPALDRLQAEAARHGLRAFRILFLDACAPDLPDVLSSAGYIRTQKRILACASGSLRLPEAVAGLDLRPHDAGSPETELTVALRVNRRGFDMLDLTITAEDIEVYRRELGDGCGITAYLEGIPVATGLYSPLIDRLTKVAGITTLKAYRQRGIGSVLTAELTRLAFAAGADTVFLVARDEQAGRVYEHLGYSHCANRLLFSL